MTQALAAVAAVFVTVFLAELGDKTQLATVLFAASGQRSPWLVFVAAAAALVLSTAIAVVAGVAAERYLTATPLKLLAGIVHPHRRLDSLVSFRRPLRRPLTQR